MDRRSVLTGMGLFTLAGCTGAGTSPQGERPGIDLSDLEARQGGRLGIQVVGAETVGWRASERFTYCSTFKLFLAAAVLQQADRGEVRLDRQIPITGADMVFHAPVTGPAVGKTLSVEALCKATVELSDNPAANILIREMGGLDAWRAWYRGIGDTVTRVDRLEPALNGIGDERDTTTPEQTATNLGKVLSPDASLLTPPSRERLMTWLIETPTGPNRLKAAAPLGWTVAHKTGTSNAGPVNDIGLMLPPQGQPVYVVAYYQGPETDDFAEGEVILAEAVHRALKAAGHD